MVPTHFQDEAEYCDRLVIMGQGRILAEGASESLKAACQDVTHPAPSMEDAFVALIEADTARSAAQARAA